MRSDIPSLILLAISNDQFRVYRQLANSPDSTLFFPELDWQKNKRRLFYLSFKIGYLWQRF